MVASSGRAVKSDKRVEQLGREDWLRAALAMVATTGVDGLRVQELAGSLGATTGSLYWHFSNREKLLDALLGYWKEQSTEAIARQIEASEGSPEGKLLDLMRMISADSGTASDLALRQWAQSDARAAKVVAQVDARRAQVVERLFEEMGFREPELTMRTHVVLTYESCERAVATRRSRAERARLLEARHRMLCTH